MVIYKVKIKVKKERASAWFNWMSDIHIPEVINTGHFIDYSFLRQYHNGESHPGVEVYEIQYVCKNQQELEDYKRNDAEAIRKKHSDLFGDAIIDVVRSEYVDMTIPELVESIDEIVA